MRFEAKGGPFQACSLRLRGTNHCCQGSNDQKYVGQKHVLNLFFRRGTISATSIESSLCVLAILAMLEGIGNLRSSNALKPFLMVQSHGMRFLGF